MLAEDEAQEKWCPYRDEQRTEWHTKLFDRCVASKCMAWRWARAKETKAYLDAVQKHMKDTGDNFNKATQKVYAEIGSTFEQVEGYCGLAGKPE